MISAVQREVVAENPPERLFCKWTAEGKGKDEESSICDVGRR